MTNLYRLIVLLFVMFALRPASTRTQASAEAPPGPMLSGRWRVAVTVPQIRAEASVPLAASAPLQDVVIRVDTGAEAQWIRADVHDSAGRLILVGNPVYFSQATKGQTP